MAKLTPLKVTYNSDGSATYLSIKDDVVGLLCCRHYGHEWGTTEVVLEANPGLAELGPFIPAGISILLPVVQDPGSQDTRNTVNLYD